VFADVKGARSRMSLPTSQQRALGRIEVGLRAADPHLASMFAIFGRLNTGEPVAAERLAKQLRLRWLRPRLGVFAAMLIPVMFIAMIVVAALAGGGLSPRACGGRYGLGGASPLARPACRLTADTTTVKSAPVATPAASAGTENPTCIALVQHGRSARGWVCYK
jgi:hypothetical protein